MADQDSPILCPNCATGYAWRYDAGNKRVTCKCNAIFRVPLNSFSPCQLIAKPGQPLPTPPDSEFAIQEDPVEPPGYLKEVSLEPAPDEALLTAQEASQGTPPAPTPPPQASPSRPIPKRPQIIPFADSIPSPVQEPRPPQSPKPTPRPSAALTPKPPSPSDQSADPRDTHSPKAKPSLQLLCPHCQSAIPGNSPVDICPHCKSTITPLRDPNIEIDVQKTLDSPIMATLRKRGLENVVQNVAREAAERKALEKKYTFERNIFDVWVPAIAAGLAILFLLISTGISLGRFPLFHIAAHHLVWILCVILPASVATLCFGQYAIDADFQLDRVLLTKLAGIVLFPYGLAMLLVPSAFSSTDLFPYACLLILTIGAFMAILGTVYRLPMGQAALLTGVYALITAFLSATISSQLIKLLTQLLKTFFRT